MFNQQTNVNEKMSYLDTVSSETLTYSKVLSKKIRSYVESDGSISFFMETA
ncbi:MAG TPA: hypothetical protein VF220_05395 [Nitrososphaeraceae archaeon]